MHDEGSCQIGHTNHSAQEINIFLEKVWDVLPTSGMEWDLIATQQSLYLPKLDCTGQQLKKKFNKLQKNDNPTGDPNIPEEISRVKAIGESIIKKLMVQLDPKKSCSHQMMLNLKLRWVAKM